MTGELPHKGPIMRERFPCHDAYCEVSQGSAHPYGSGMVAPKGPQCSFDEMATWASEILKSIKSEHHSELVYCSRSATHFISLTKVINSLLVFLLKNKCEKKPFRLTQQGVTVMVRVTASKLTSNLTL